MRCELGSANRIHQAFEGQVRLTPTATAVVADGHRASYLDVDRAANAVAWELRARGVRPRSLVGVCLPRDRWLVPALLGVLKAGCGYVPLDPAYPTNRLGFMVRDASLSHVVTATAVAESCARAVRGTGALTVVVDGLDPRDVPAPDVPGDGRDVAYVLYTSGSTGAPKGVVVEHRNVLELLGWAADTCSDAELRTVLGSSSICFDASVVELFTPLVTGGSVVLGENLLALPTLAERDEVTLIQGVPSTVAALLRTALPHGVRTVLVAGEPLSRSLVDRLYAIGTVHRVINCYGPTETTVNCSWVEVNRHDRGEPPIGRPLPGARLSVRDRDGDPVTDGEVGELWVGGPLVSRGYLGRPELTAERFVTAEGVRYYRTGDQVRCVEGIHHFVGRLDDQVKVGGIRVELDEVASVLVGHPAVNNAVVLAPTVTGGERRLVGYVEPVADPPTEDELRDWLRARVPRHCVPSRIVVMDRIPLGPTGKADRGALPQVTFGRSRARRYVPARTDTERLVTVAMSDVLGLPDIGVHDGFTDSGGHSLAAARLVTELNVRLGRSVSLATFLAGDTAAALAAELDKPADGGPEPDLTRHHGRDRYPLTRTQRDLWMLSRLSVTGTATTVATRIRVRGPWRTRLPVDAVRAATDAIVRRHEVLRSVVRAGEGEPIAEVRSPAPVPARHHDLRSLPPTVRSARAAELAVAAARHSFDLSADTPLLRITVIDLDSGLAELVVVSDHIAVDGVSIALLAEELAAGIGAALAGGPTGGTSPPLPAVQTGDVALHERALATQADRQRRLTAFWSTELAGCQPPHGLFQRISTTATAFRGGSVSLRLSAGMPVTIQRFAAESGVTTFAVYLAALAVLVGGTLDSDDVLLGAAAAQRAHPDLDRTVGPLVEVLPIRLRWADDTSFRELCEHAMGTTSRALDHLGLSQDQVFQAASKVRSPVATLTPVALSVQPAGIHTSVTRAGVRADLLGDVATGGVHNPLTVFVDTAEDTVLRLEYDQEFLSDADATVLAARLADLLGRLLSAPDIPLTGVDLVDRTERATLVTLGTGPALPEHDDTVVRTVLDQAARRPGRVAVTGGGGDLTFGALAEWSARVACGLFEAGVRRGDLVAVCLPRDEFLPAALLAVWRAGAGYLPIDPDHPVERTAWIAVDAGVRMVLARGEALAAARGLPVTVVDADLLAAQAGHGDLPLPGPDDVAYVLYTSGSTGHPKGVEVTHANVAAMIAARTVIPGPTEDGAMLALAPLTFDASVEELWWPLAVGARCVLATRDQAVDGSALADQLAASGATVVFMAPTSLRMLLAAGWPGDPGLRLRIGGEVFDPALAQTILPLVRQVWNVYGPTEATVMCAGHPVSAGDVTGEASVPIGQPYAGHILYVMDRVGRLMPRGAVGELWVAGAGVTRGYRNQPELTVAAFPDDPVRAGQRCFRTGDLVRWRRDGALEFHGRADQQVKIRGNRVELGEIEHALLDLPQVHNAVVTVHSSGEDNHLVGYLTPSTVDFHAVESALDRRLPGYLVPRRWVAMDGFPSLPSGKIDRRALPAPSAHIDRPRTPPRGTTELAVAHAWQAVLGLDSVGVEDHFFALGGHSLAATRVAARLREVLGRRLPVRMLFENPVLGDLAAALDTLPAQEPAGAGGIPRREDPDAPAELSRAQRRMWFAAQLDPDSRAYNSPLVLRLRGTADDDALVAAVRALAERHHVLRSVFPDKDGEPAAVLGLAADVPVATVTVPAGEVAAVVAAEIARPFRLDTQPPMRAMLFRVAPDERVLLLTFHHIAVDGDSIPVLLTELAELYSEPVSGEAARPERLQYADYAAWQASPAGAPDPAQLAYWLDRLAGLPPLLDLPTDRVRPATADWTAGEVPVRVPAGLTTRLRMVAANAGCTPFMVLLAAWQAVLSGLAGVHDVAVGVPKSTRSRTELDGLVGFFVNTVVMRTDLSGDPTWTELLARVRDTVLGAFSNADMPFDAVVEGLRPPRGRATTPVFQVMLNLLESPVRPTGMCGLRVEMVDQPWAQAHFDLSLELRDRGDTYDGLLVYRLDLFDRITVERWARLFVSMLDAMARRPGDRVPAVDA